MHKYIVCIGSNYNRNKNLFFARQQLTTLFPLIHFTPERETEPLLLKNPALFSNQVAVFFSREERESVQIKLKKIEASSGRLPKDKLEEKVCLDIDLLLYDDQIVKPEDCERKYVKELLSFLPSSFK